MFSEQLKTDPLMLTTCVGLRQPEKELVKRLKRWKKAFTGFAKCTKLLFECSKGFVAAAPTPLQWFAFDYVALLGGGDQSTVTTIATWFG